MKNDSSPFACLPFEHECAKSLHWLPLAVRYKLDGAGLKLSLNQWQSLTISTRLDLVQLLPVQGFAETALKSGAYFVGAPQIQAEMDEVEAAQLLECTSQEASLWLALSTPFARYALRKRAKAVFELGEVVAGGKPNRYGKR